MDNPFDKRESPRDAVAREVLRAVHATGRVVSAHYDRADFSIAYRRAGDNADGRIYLDNIFRETSAVEPAERAWRIERLVTAVVGHAGENTWEQARPKLRPVIRGVTFGAGTAATAGDESKALVSRPVLPFLMEAVVVDEPTSMGYVNRSRLAEWGVSEDEVFATARANLAAMVGPIPASDRPAMLRFVETGDEYFTSRLLVDGFLAGLAGRVGGRPVAFVPDRDTLLVVGDEPGLLRRVYAMVEEDYSSRPRSISPVGYTVDERGHVVPYAAPAGSDLASVVHRAEVVLAASEYGVQKKELDRVHERDGVAVFVGSLIAIEPGDSSSPATGDPAVASIFSVAVWAQDVDTLLPQADFVGFQPATPDEQPLTVPFDIVAREALLVAEPDYLPPRYRVTGWPDEAVMARLRPHAVAL